MLTRTLHSLENTAALARALADALTEHLRIHGTQGVAALFLRGDLGSGKTTFVRALVRALPGGHKAEVASPSFTLCHEYPTTPVVFHCDLYRTPASLPEEVWEALENPAVLTVVEWAEYMPPAALPKEYLDISLKTCKEKKLVRVTPHGLAAHELVSALQNNYG